MIRKVKYILMPFLLATIIVIGSIQDKANSRDTLELPKKDELLSRKRLPLAFEPVKDTIYVLGDEYIEICLQSQKAKLVTRQGETFEYKISSGNPFISKGMETTTGIFTIQSKSPKAISKQFENAELFWWIGFNGNIGFHGLAGNGYYNHLGTRPSSHGCVRISREDGKDLYDRVKIGTPVLVYKNEPARILAFAEWDYFVKTSPAILITDDNQLSKLLNKRLENLYAGKAHTGNRYKLFIDGATKLRAVKIKEGDFKKVSPVQELPFAELALPQTQKDRMQARILEFIIKDEKNKN